MRTQAERRFNTNVKLRRKVEIVKETFNIYSVESLLNDKRYVGKLKKGKVHCSCPMCATKTKVHGMKHSEKKKMEPIKELY